jgi:hypothetical protein
VNSIARGRDREIAEIVNAKRAAFVVRMLLGDVDRFEEITEDEFREWPRKKLKRQRDVVRRKLAGEIKKFCQMYFRDLTEQKLSNLYTELMKPPFRLRMPLLEFRSRYGTPNGGVLRGAPLHSTVCISHWGLQTEYPEMHLCHDLAEAVNQLLDTHQDELIRIESYGNSWSQAKRDRSQLAALQRRSKFNSRMALIASFNLVEAYLNGIAWEWLHTVEENRLSENHRMLLAEDPRPVSLIEKLKQFPKIIKGASEGPLHDSRDPLRSFIEMAKPFRDAIVHASPFSAPKRFGGYDKLDKIYSLTTETALRGVDLSLSVIGSIHQFLDGDGDMPPWFLQRDRTGRFDLGVNSEPGSSHGLNHAPRCQPATPAANE